jgi:hypothetical protein
VLHSRGPGGVEERQQRRAHFPQRRRADKEQPINPLERARPRAAVEEVEARRLRAREESRRGRRVAVSSAYGKARREAAGDDAGSHIANAGDGASAAVTSTRVTVAGGDTARIMLPRRARGTQIVYKYKIYCSRRGLVDRLPVRGAFVAFLRLHVCASPVLGTI